MDQIYVVIGTTGEYSDRTEWFVCAYRDEAVAERVVTELSAAAKEIEARCQLEEGDPNYLDRYECRYPNEGQKGWPTPDTQFQMDYTGTTYSVANIDLI